MADKNILRIGALLAFLGAVTLVVSTLFHAAHADPGDTPAAFQDYATSSPWIAAHLGQFIGTILILGAMNDRGETILLEPEAEVPLGAQVL